MRTARVEIGGKPKGTGFLIGNSLLLRAWHVVERYDDNGGIAIFDNKVSVPGKDEQAGCADGCVCNRVVGRAQLLP